MMSPMLMATPEMLRALGQSLMDERRRDEELLMAPTDPSTPVDLDLTTLSGYQMMNLMERLSNERDRRIAGRSFPESAGTPVSRKPSLEDRVAKLEREMAHKVDRTRPDGASF
jgi:hypothetical protein